MKMLLLFVVLSIVVCEVTFAQSDKELAKERNELMKASKAELNDKGTKAIRKEAKKFKKEGWTTAPSALPLEKQFFKEDLEKQGDELHNKLDELLGW